GPVPPAARPPRRREREGADEEGPAAAHRAEPRCAGAYCGWRLGRRPSALFGGASGSVAGALHPALPFRRTRPVQAFPVTLTDSPSPVHEAPPSGRVLRRSARPAPPSPI